MQLGYYHYDRENDWRLYFAKIVTNLTIGNGIWDRGKSKFAIAILSLKIRICSSKDLFGTGCLPSFNL